MSSQQVRQRTEPGSGRRERAMRYVGRHRAPRPLLLRRPIVGGVAAAVVVAVPAWVVTGGPLNGSPSGKATSNASVRLAEGTQLPASTDGSSTSDGGQIAEVP